MLQTQALAELQQRHADAATKAGSEAAGLKLQVQAALRLRDAAVERGTETNQVRATNVL